MSECNCSAIGVDFLFIQAQLSDACDGLTGKGFVEFEDIDVFLVDASVFVEGWNSIDGADAHFVRRAAFDLGANEAAQRLQSALFCP